MHIYVHLSVEARDQRQLSFPIAPTSFGGGVGWGQDLPLFLCLADLIRPAAHSLQCSFAYASRHTQMLLGCWGSELEFSCLFGKQFAD